MTIDTSKIRAGDKVQLEFTVVESTLPGHALCFRVSNEYGKMTETRVIDSPVQNFTIVGHTPAPWEPKAGDQIQSKSNPLVKGKILHIDVDGDWLFKSAPEIGSTKSVIRKTNHQYYKLDNG